jgi:hypothetical protein
MIDIQAIRKEVSTNIYQPYGGSEEEANKMILQLCDEVERHQWISVEEQLPPAKRFYLTHRKRGEIGKTWFCRTGPTTGYWTSDNYICVTHWMPLPEPPEDSDDNMSEWMKLQESINREMVELAKRVEALEDNAHCPDPPQETPKGYWECTKCGDKPNWLPIDQMDKCLVGDNMSCVRHKCHGTVEWHEQPQPKKPDELEGMERYIGMPCFFSQEVFDYKYIGVLKRLSKYDDGNMDLFVDETGEDFSFCKPHPISEEVWRLREENELLQTDFETKKMEWESDQTSWAIAYQEEIEQLKAELAQIKDT